MKFKLMSLSFMMTMSQLAVAALPPIQPIVQNPEQYDTIPYIEDGISYGVIGKQGKYGIVDINGNIVIPVVYKDVTILNNSGLFAIKNPINTVLLTHQAKRLFLKFMIALIILMNQVLPKLEKTINLVLLITQAKRLFQLFMMMSNIFIQASLKLNKIINGEILINLVKSPPQSSMTI